MWCKDLKLRILIHLVYLMPRSLVYCAAVRFWAHATTTDEGVHLTLDEMTFTKATEIWNRR